MRQSTILVVPISAVGHVNACVGTLKPLLQIDYRVIFVVEKAFRGKLEPFGFEEFIFEVNQHEKVPGQEMAEDLLKNEIIGVVDVETQLKNTMDYFLNSEEAKKNMFVSNRAVEQAIEQFNPDLFVVDHTYLLPVIYYTNKPWIHIKSIAPLFYVEDENLPPPMTGLSIHSDKKTWIKYCNILKDIHKSKVVNDRIEEMGYKRYPGDICMPKTQEFSVYATPEEMNYPQLKCKAEWINLEVFNKPNLQSKVNLASLVPKEFLENDLNGQYSGKLIYLSLGSMGSIDLQLMRRLVSVLGRTKHKFIVSKGPRHAEFELASNMWGKSFLPQTDLLPWVDLVITHGGNNTTTETFALGKPMVVMPLFGDQHDNAQRLHQTGLGIHVPPYSFEDHQLVEAIDQLLNNTNLKVVLCQAANRIQTSTKHQLVCDRIKTILQSK